MLNLISKGTVSLIVAGVLVASSSFAGFGVDWDANYSYMYDSDGNPFTENLLVQVVLDMGNNTDFGSMETSGMLAAGSEVEFGGVHSSATDDVVVGAFQEGFWVWTSGFDDMNGAGKYDVGDVSQAEYYLRWFNGSTYAGATEIGYLYGENHVGGTGWLTPEDTGGVTPSPSYSDATYGAVGTSGTIYDGGANDGWATVAAVPEPGSMGLLALGLVTLVARKRKRA